MARNVSISVKFTQWFIETRNVAVGEAFILMKASDGKRIHPDRYKQKTLDKMVKLNLLGVDPRGGYWQRSWEETHQVLKFDKELSFTKITKRMLDKYEIQDLAFLIQFNYKFQLQKKDCRNHSGRHLQQSIHVGGLSHSLMAALFDRSINWCYLRRVSCHKRGLILFERRTAMAREMEPHELPETDIPYRSFDITSAADIRVKLDFFVPKFLRHKLKKKVFSAKEGCYIMA